MAPDGSTGMLSLTNGFSPLHEGDTSVASFAGGAAVSFDMFQSPSRGGHLRGFPQLACRQVVFEFQSPSRGGHLRGRRLRRRLALLLFRFSPLHEGDTSVASASSRSHAKNIAFQSPSRGGHLRGEP